LRDPVVVCAGEEMAVDPEDRDVVFDGFKRFPVILTWRIGPGARLWRRNVGSAMQTV
jgi:hypothetical protein